MVFARFGRLTPVQVWLKSTDLPTYQRTDGHASSNLPFICFNFHHRRLSRLRGLKKWNLTDAVLCNWEHPNIFTRKNIHKKRYTQDFQILRQKYSAMFASKEISTCTSSRPSRVLPELPVFNRVTWKILWTFLVFKMEWVCQRKTL